MKASFDEWLEAVKQSAGKDYDEFEMLYSFQTAYDEGMKPNEAVQDCREWLEEK